MKIIAEIQLSGRSEPISSGWKPRISSNGSDTIDVRIQLLGKLKLKPTEKAEVEISSVDRAKLQKNEPFKIYEGFREVGIGTVKRVVA